MSFDPTSPEASASDRTRPAPQGGGDAPTLGPRAILRAKTFSWCLIVAALAVSILPSTSSADGAGPKEMAALEACLDSDVYPENECFDVPYDACMEVQSKVAANPLLARERCLGQELVVWYRVLRDTCSKADLFFQSEGSMSKLLCSRNGTPAFENLVQMIDAPRRESQLLYLELFSQSVRLHAVQLRRFLQAYDEYGFEEVYK